MHIAFISPFYGETQVNSSGGAQVWAAQFMLEAIKRGHTFDHFAVKGSLEVPGKITLHATLDQGIKDVLSDPFIVNSSDGQKDKESYVTKGAINTLFAIKENEDQYDLIIDSSGARPLISSAWNNFKKPLIVIGHDAVTAQYVRIFQFFPLSPNISFVFPTRIQENAATWIPNEKKHTVHHGIDIFSLPFISKPKDNHLIFIGRYHTNTPKGLDDAADVANALNFPLDLYTVIDESQRNSYNATVLPKVENKPHIKIITPPQPPKNEIFQNGKVFLFPTKCEESFGLVLIEAMATGTPVIAYARGSVPEIIQDGVTGFIVNPSDDDIRGDFITKKTGVEGMIEAVKRLYALPEGQYLQMRNNAREAVEKEFTIQKMVDEYEKVFKKVITM
jgi:glycosyltransferase involved in cell wall biosynthesis